MAPRYSDYAHLARIKEWLTPARARPVMTPPIPTGAQRQALDRGASVWVAASAGTGKTKVLTDRVLTLMLAAAIAVAHPLPHLHRAPRRPRWRTGVNERLARLDDDRRR